MEEPFQPYKGKQTKSSWQVSRGLFTEMYVDR